ncbi:GntR family transcriptional regulator [Pseudonocardia spinosispora]|uniref:GntR family transcriptional regulator n=1 Tax=Pseudonocardia spinosispora TaxID=103441 RepID=UPI00041D67CA|nr:GntR family transcriptional regulator [Pseudonocardia spinosispora]
MPKLSGITAVERPPTLSRRAYLQIQQAIRDGAIRQEVLYSENELAETLGMSRTPVREALISLSREGLVAIESQRGFRLRRLSASERQEVFDLRSLLEGHCARRLAETATEDDVRRLNELIDGQRIEGAAGRMPEFLALDEEFHLVQAELLGLERTRATMVSLRGAMWLIGFEALALPHRHENVVAEHRAIVDAIERRDPDAAEAAAKAHIATTATAVRESENDQAGQNSVGEPQA